VEFDHPARELDFAGFFLDPEQAFVTDIHPDSLSL